MVRYTFILFGLFANLNLCLPTTQNSGDATGCRNGCCCNDYYCE